ncbi:uncharacterized RING finger protein C4G3.12c isoform X2 [Neltuma alba]|uniref:uncharacterized RING finger protein C4G3.12c isoform X2 n=1 Tax=Neltuma alba TaxID=207710 RepID=UPI0010A38F91|nr:uncharacterized RING finger protein C4G3.12c isoform X2 [Prosopis alba]
MGSSGSKGTSSCSSSSSSGSFRKVRSKKGHRGFQSYCLGTTSGSHDAQNKTNGNGVTYNCYTGTRSNEMKSKSFRDDKRKTSDDMPCMPSNIDLSEWDQTSISSNSSRTRSRSTRASSTGGRFLSRFSLIPGNISFRLSRTTSLGSSRSCHASSTTMSIFNNEDDRSLHPGPTGSLVNRNETRQSDSSGNLQGNPSSSSRQNAVRDGNGSCEGLDLNLFSSRIHAETENIEGRQNGAREPVERNFRYSRTLSVGRLRNRVLRQSAFSDVSFCPRQQEREARDTREDNERQAGEGDSRVLPSFSNAINSSSMSGYPPSSISNSLFNIQDYEVENSRSRETRYQDLLEHRSNFLERRRRIRSQVRALQRLGSRFENLSGHDRSCILSGQHRNGHCTCRIGSRDTSSIDDTGTRASISRIVMLAEALFEVLDEIHQQSAVLSSRPSVSSIGSVPAPNDVVESLPVKTYTKLHKHQEDAAQCYICLVEYEDGDSIRELPCHHQFHRTCIDKWLKEIHRVCPLCRRDICISDSLSMEN